MAVRQQLKDFDPPLLVVLTACLLLAGLKNDTSLASNADQITEFISHPWVNALKHQILFVTLPPIFAAVAYSLLRARYRVAFTSISILICMMPLYAGLRSALENTDLALKPLQAFALFAFLSVYIAFRRANIGPRLTLDTACWAFFVFAVILVGINFLTYKTGYGYVGTSERFFGTTVQPNFIGAQMAICGIIFLYVAVTHKGMFRPIATVLLIAAVFLVVQTGSRTALVIFTVGSYFGTWRLVHMRAKIVTALIAGAVLTILLASGWGPGSDVFNVYERGGAVDTRSAAWLYLIEQIARRPLFGLGFFEGASENSLMRGWAAFGLPYVLILTAVIGMTALTLRRASTQVANPQPSTRLMSGLFFGLVAGGLFEGYLCDNLTVTIVTFVIVVSTAHAPKKQTVPGLSPPRTHDKTAMDNPAHRSAVASLT